MYHNINVHSFIAQGECKVRPGYIETIEGTGMSVSPTAIDSSCEIVLAHDCSPQKLFTVISTPVTETGTRKIKILLPSTKVEIESSNVHSGAILKINGEIKSVYAPIVRTIPTIEGRSVFRLPYMYSTTHCKRCLQCCYVHV